MNAVTHEEFEALKARVDALESALDVEKSNRGNEDNRLSRQIGSLQMSEQRWSVTFAGVERNDELGRHTLESTPFALNSSGIVLVFVNGYIRFRSNLFSEPAAEFVKINYSLVKADGTEALTSNGEPIQPQPIFFPVSKGRINTTKRNEGERYGNIALTRLHLPVPPGDYKIRLNIPQDWLREDGTTGTALVWQAHGGATAMHATIITLPDTDFINVGNPQD
jgi:hypothetical protein